jgi:hypothetical protein
MGLGQKLQAAYNKVNTRLGTQQGPVVFTKRANTPAAEFGLPYASTAPSSTVTLNSGVAVGWVSAREVFDGGTWEIGDIKIQVPGNLINETQIDGATVFYNNVIYSVVTWNPKGVYSGVVTLWEIVGRQQR